MPISERWTKLFMKMALFDILQHIMLNSSKMVVASNHLTYFNYLLFYYRPKKRLFSFLKNKLTLDSRRWGRGKGGRGSGGLQLNTP